mmetsp:Transcript_37433/g.149357  ORF Transcript_37433/g.149357 Transcript_37433/m.149357 type:complete len:98 (+) Transcript_37433:1624-1917(+)
MRWMESFRRRSSLSESPFRQAVQSLFMKFHETLLRNKWFGPLALFKGSLWDKILKQTGLELGSFERGVVTSNKRTLLTVSSGCCLGQNRCYVLCEPT